MVFPCETELDWSDPDQLHWDVNECACSGGCKYKPMSFPSTSLCWISRIFCNVDCSTTLATVWIFKSATMDPVGLMTIAIVVILQRLYVKRRDDIPAGASSMMAALGFALLKPFHRLSRRALSLGDSKYLAFSSDPPLRLLANEIPLDLGRGREPGEVGVVGPWSMLAMKSDTEWVCNLLQRSRGMCRARYSDKAMIRLLIARVVPANECTPLSDDNAERVTAMEQVEDV